MKTYMPWTPLGDSYVVIMLGDIDYLEVGECQNVEDMTDRSRYKNQVIQEVIRTTIIDTPQTVMEALGFQTFGQFRAALSEKATIPLPAEAAITIVLFAAEQDTEESVVDFVAHISSESEYDDDDDDDDDDAFLESFEEDIDLDA